uniref:Receptor-binding cancer antigen expressed on SiSo cells n=1 Tax=Photinus pyralis TaxID=7054 RepID=A0A1Y1KSS1_PHOPY
MIEIIFKMFKSLFFFIVSIFKRALCCFRRRKRVNEFVPLTQVGVISEKSIPNEMDSWNDWNEPVATPSTPTTVQEQIEYYRQQAIAARQVKEEPQETQENFFEDMMPTITAQTKVYINPNVTQSETSNKFSLAPENINVMSKELEEWDDERGWEDQTLDIDAREALKESRREARQKKAWEQQQRRQEKLTRGTLGAKVYA